MRISFTMPDDWNIFDLEKMIRQVNEDGKTVTVSPRSSIERAFVHALKRNGGGLKVRSTRVASKKAGPAVPQAPHAVSVKLGSESPARCAALAM